MYEDTLIYGRDPDPGIVALAPLYSKKKTETMRVFYREDGNLFFEDYVWHPYFYIRHPKYVKGHGEVVKLKGNQYYQYLVWFDNYKQAKEAYKAVQQRTGKEKPVVARWIGGREQQFLTQTGKTLFKGLEFDDVVALSLDIETYTEHGFPNAERDEDEVVIVSLMSNNGFKAVLHTNPSVDCEHGRAFETEEELLVALADIIVNEVDPDVLLGHYVFDFDISYLAARYKKYDLELDWSRQGRGYSYPSSYRTAERINDFTCWYIPGRHVIDTMIAAKLWDMVARELPNYQLKPIARHFGFAAENRTYVEGHDIPRVWKEDPKRLLDYAFDDAQETLSLYKHLLGSVFYMTQMMPQTYERVARIGTGTKILSLFVREYFRQQHSIPKPESGRQDGGGLTRLFYKGVLGPVTYADVESLYPSIMLNYNIQPERDELKLFSEFLQVLTDRRFETKNKMREHEKGTQEYVRLDASQSSYKILINSFYGILGFANNPFNDYSEADRVTSTGRDLLMQIVDYIEANGGIVVEIDTDGVLFIPPEEHQGEEKERAFVEGITKHMPEGITIGFDGRAQTMVSYRKKNYALLEYDGKLKIKGSALISRGMSPFIVDFVKKGYQLAAEYKVRELRDLYVKYRSDILYRRVPIDMIAEKRTLHKTLDQYVTDVNAGGNRSAAYELGIIQAQRGMQVRKGDQVRYYICGTNPRVLAFEAAKLVSDYEDDYNVLFYAEKLDSALDRFRFMFYEEDFDEIFRTTGVMPVNLEGIEYIITEVDE